MKSEYKTEEYQMLYNGLIVPKHIYDETRNQVTDISTVLLPNAEYALKLLCDINYWLSLSHHQRIQAGLSMASMVRCNLVPYCFSGRPCQSPKVFTVIR